MRVPDVQPPVPDADIFRRVPDRDARSGARRTFRIATQLRPGPTPASIRPRQTRLTADGHVIGCIASRSSPTRSQLRAGAACPWSVGVGVPRHGPGRRGRGRASHFRATSTSPEAQARFRSPRTRSTGEIEAQRTLNPRSIRAARTPDCAQNAEKTGPGRPVHGHSLPWCRSDTEAVPGNRRAGRASLASRGCPAPDERGRRAWRLAGATPRVKAPAA